MADKPSHLPGIDQFPGQSLEKSGVEKSLTNGLKVLMYHGHIRDIVAGTKIFQSKEDAIHVAKSLTTLGIFMTRDYKEMLAVVEIEGGFVVTSVSDTADIDF